MRHFNLLLSGLFCLVGPSLAQADETMVTAEILPGWRQEDGTHMAALRLLLAPGWKTFWRAPGDAGIPPRIHTDGSTNVADLRSIWPRPDVFDLSGMRTIGYRSELVLPLALTPEVPGAAMRLEGRVELGLCKDVCMPASLEFAADLPLTDARDGRIQAALVDVPFTAREAGVTSVHCATAPAQYGQGFRAEITVPEMAGRETVVVETSDPLIWVAETRSWWDGPVLITETELAHADQPGFAIDPEAVRITILGETMAVDIQGCDPL